MTKLRTFTFRLNDDERDLIEKLAERLQRNQSDAVRLVIREAFKSLEAQEAPEGMASSPRGA